MNAVIENVLRALTTFSVSKVVRNKMSTTVLPNTNWSSRVVTAVGGILISAVLSDLCADHLIEMVTPPEIGEEVSKYAASRALAVDILVHDSTLNTSKDIISLTERVTSVFANPAMVHEVCLNAGILFPSKKDIDLAYEELGKKSSDEGGERL